jgi:N-acetyl-anhydromuramyl-L-alanine amidase AmpD
MLEILDKKTKNSLGVEKNKKQIILTHTKRNINEYLSALRYRYDKKYTKLPHYIITREGIILQIMGDEEFGNYLNNPTFDKQSIIICLENLGWLEKQPLKNHYINWIGSIYKKNVFDRKWRDYFFWEPYTEIQLEKTVELCVNLTEKFKIEPICIGHNTKTSRLEGFNGILSRSNIDQDSTDLSPAFDFEYFIKLLEDEQLRRN